MARAAASGYPDAEFFLGSSLLQDSARQAEGLHWIERAAQVGQEEAPSVLCKLYFGDGGHPATPTSALQWCKEAAEHGSVYVFDERLEAFVRARGDPDAQYRMGRVLIEGLFDIRKDEAMGVEWFRRAAAAGHGAARSELQHRGLSWSLDKG